MNGDADTVSRDAVREAGDVCPFLSMLEDGGNAAGDRTDNICLSRSNDPITISARYVEAYCLTARHRSCSLYLHAGDQRQAPETRDEPLGTLATAGSAQGRVETPQENAARAAPTDRGPADTYVLRPEAAAMQPAPAPPAPRDVEEARRVEAQPASATALRASSARAGEMEILTVRREPAVLEPARLRGTEVRPRAGEAASSPQPIMAGPVELEPVETMPVETERAPVSAVEGTEVIAVPLETIALEAAEIAPKAGGLLAQREPDDRGARLETAPREVVPEAAVPRQPPITSREQVVAEPQAVEPSRAQVLEESGSREVPAAEPAAEKTQRLDRAALAAVAERARMMAETGGVARATAPAAEPAEAPQPRVPEPAGTERAARRSLPRALILGLLLLVALIVIAAIALFALGGSHRAAKPVRLATRPPHTAASPTVVSPTAVRPPVTAPRLRRTAVRAPTTSTRVVVPPPASAWHFAALQGSPDAIVLMFSNPNGTSVKATVQFSGGLRTRLRIPAKSGTQLELSPQATSAIDIRATAPIITGRTVIHGSTTHISYGVPIEEVGKKRTP